MIMKNSTKIISDIADNISATAKKDFLQIREDLMEKKKEEVKDLPIRDREYELAAEYKLITETLYLQNES